MSVRVTQYVFVCVCVCWQLLSRLVYCIELYVLILWQCSDVLKHTYERERYSVFSVPLRTSFLRWSVIN